MPGNALAPDGAANGMVPVHVAHCLAAWGGALPFLSEDGEAEAVLGSEQELLRCRPSALLGRAVS